MSLRSSHYFSDQVSLAISLEQTSDRDTQALVDNLPWPHGQLTLRHRIILGGLMPAIVESWYPSSNDSYGVFLEDDIEVSPYFYSWLKFTILYYRYYTPAREISSHLFGISLYQQKVNELRPTGRAAFDAHTILASIGIPANSPYLSQVPCSWGAIYFPEIWKEFHDYLSLRLSESSLAISDFIVPEIKSNRWPRSWKKYFIELVFLRGYTMLYPNYDHHLSFSTNHLEKGEHANIVDAKRRAQFQVPLMNSSNILALPRNQLPSFTELPITDLWGILATEEEIIERGWQSLTQMDLCPNQELRIDGELTYDARELLCRREYEVDSLIITKNLENSKIGIDRGHGRVPLVEPLELSEEQKQGGDFVGDLSQMEMGAGHVHEEGQGDGDEEEEDQDEEEWDEEEDDEAEGEEE